MTTTAADIMNQPAVMNDIMNAFFAQKLGLVSLGVRNDTLTQSPGTKMDFPYWKMMGAVEELTEGEAMSVDKLTDGKFSVTIKEIGKAVGFTDTALRSLTIGKTPEEAADIAKTEAMRQLSIQFANKLDLDVIAMLKLAENYHQGFTAAAATDVFNVGNLLDQKITSFGDKQEEANAVLMHSLHLASLLKDNSTGFLKADATHPFFGVSGYQGLLLGQSVFVNDRVPELEAVGGKKVFASYTFKPEPFGLIHAKDFHIESDRDMLARQTIIGGTMWYGLTGLHGKVSVEDRRISMGAYATSVGA